MQGVIWTLNIMNNWKPELIVIVFWFMYRLLIIWLATQIYLQTHFIIEWAITNLQSYEFPILKIFMHLYDLILITILTIPFAIFAVKILPSKSLWPTLAISVCLVFLWEYRLPFTDYETFVAVFSFSQAYIGHFYVLFLLPIIAYFIKRLDRAKSI